MALEVIVGPPFSAKSWWARREIERREEAGERGLLLLSYTAMFSAIAPGSESTYRDEEVSDSGSPRLAGWLLAAATAEAHKRQINGYLAVDSPRRALAVLAQLGGTRLIEVEISEREANRRADEHVELISELAPRAGADDARAATSRCRKMVSAYFQEREALDAVDVRKVRAPRVPPPSAIQYAYTAALKARRRGDDAAVRKWLTAAKDWSKAHGLPTAGIRV